jgi:TIR domain
VLEIDVRGSWSYAREDDGDDDNRIVQLAHDIQREFSIQTDQELKLFLDRDSIAWGDEWRARISDALAGTTFFIPIITPRYFRRSNCRTELLTFARAAKAAGLTRLVLPIYYVSVSEMAASTAEESDEAMAVVARTQYTDWRELRSFDRKSSEYKQGIRKLAERLVSVAVELSNVPVAIQEDKTGGDDDADNDDDDSPGIVDILAEAEKSFPLISESLTELSNDIEDVGSRTEDSTRLIAESDARGQGFAGRLTVLRRLGAELLEPASRIETNGTIFAQQLAGVDLAVTHIIRSIPSTLEELSEEDLAETRAFVTSLLELHTATASTVPILEGFAGSLRENAGLSRDLRPALSKIQNGVRATVDGTAILVGWKDLIADLDLQTLLEL